MTREGYKPHTPQDKEFRAWQLEQQGAVRAGTELRRQAAEQRETQAEFDARIARGRAERASRPPAPNPFRRLPELDETPF